MSRKQIGLRMKDETRDLLERVRGGLSRTAYIEGAVLAQIARDLKKGESWNGLPVIEDERMPKNMVMPVPQTVQEGELRDGSRIEDGQVYPETTLASLDPEYKKEKWLSANPERVRSSAESKAGVLPVPKKAQKGRK